MFQHEFLFYFHNHYITIIRSLPHHFCKVCREQCLQTETLIRSRVNISILLLLDRLPQFFKINCCLLFFNHYMVLKWLLRRSIMYVQTENIHISFSSKAALSLKLIVMMNARLGFHWLISIQSNCCFKGKIFLPMQMFSPIMKSCFSYPVQNTIVMEIRSLVVQDMEKRSFRN